MSSKTCGWVSHVIIHYIHPSLCEESLMVGRSELTIAAILQTSVLAPHFAPRITSGLLYCLVWISSVKWWFVQQAFPRSAILTEIVSWEMSWMAFSRCGFLVLSREMLPTSLVRLSLHHTN